MQTNLTPADKLPVTQPGGKGGIHSEHSKSPAGEATLAAMERIERRIADRVISSAYRVPVFDKQGEPTGRGPPPKKR